jgi:hypothetical protein
MKVREDVTRAMKYEVGNGKKTRFWHDTWRGGCPLKILCPEIFEICNQKDWSVFKVLSQGEVKLTFRRNFGEVEMDEWGKLLELIEEVNLS